MAFDIPTSKYIDVPNCGFCNSVDRFTAIIWGRLSSHDATKSQYLWKHGNPSSGDQISLRRDLTSGKWRASITAGGISVTKEPAGVTAINTSYHLAVTWQNNQANGLKIFIDGVEDGSGTSTLTQTANYDSGSSTHSIFFGARHTTSNLGVVIVEGFMIFPGTVLAAAQIAALRMQGHWVKVNVPVPAVDWRFDKSNLTFVPDLSGNGRHIQASSILSGIVSGGTIGFYEDEDEPSMDSYVAGTGGAPAPEPWTKYATDFAHGQTEFTIEGLSPGTYEVYLTSSDDVPNESAPSNTLSSVAGTAGIIHRPKLVFIR